MARHVETIFFVSLFNLTYNVHCTYTSTLIVKFVQLIALTVEETQKRPEVGCLNLLKVSQLLIN